MVQASDVRHTYIGAAVIKMSGFDTQQDEQRLVPGISELFIKWKMHKFYKQFTVGCRKAGIIFFFLGYFSSVCGAQEVFPPTKQIPLFPAAYTQEPLTIDGSLDESTWVEARIFTDFKQKNPVQGNPASYPTQVRILYDEQMLYISAVCYQPISKTRVRNLQRDFDYFQNDLFGIAIDGFLDERNATVFQVTPLGSQREMQVIDGTRDNDNWNAQWKVKTKITDTAWTLEMAIPWKTLRYPEGTDRLGVVFARNIRSKNEYTSLPAVPRIFTVYKMDYAGMITGINPPSPSTNIQINPYALTDARRLTSGNTTDSNIDPKFGGDLKWAVSTNTVLDATINTDFAQAEVDQQVINLNRFSVFFPEKRQFFLENADVFNPSVTNWIRPFFSRRIGLDESGNPIPIDGGLRLVSQNSNRQIAALAMRQRSNASNPASNFGVFRYSRNFSSQGRIGGMLTYRNDQSFNGETRSIDAHDNVTYTLDGLYRSSNNFYAQAMISGSYDDVTGDGLGAQLWTSYENNSLYIGLIEYYNRNYNPGLGLEILDDNYILTSPAFSFDLRLGWLPSFIRSYQPGSNAYIYNSSVDGRLLFGNAGLTPVSLEFQDGSEVSFTIEPNWQRLDTPFSPVDIEIAPGDYNYLRYLVTLSSDQSAAVSGSFDLEAGAFYNGRLNRYTFTTRLAPIPHIELEASYEYSRIFDLGINHVDKDTHLFSISPRLALNPRLLFSGTYQWNSAIDRQVWNARFSWEFLPLSYLYLVFNSNVFDNSDPLKRLNQQQYIGKISYIHQF